MEHSQNSPKEKQSNSVQNTPNRLNTFKAGLIVGFIGTVLLVGGGTYAIFNVFKFGSITFGADSKAVIGSPTNSQPNNVEVQGTENKVSQNTGKIDQTNSSNDSSTKIQKTDNTYQKDSNSKVGDINSGGGNVNVTITYKDNSELAGFNSAKGYTPNAKLTNIGQFSDAILISNVRSGDNYFKSKTKDIFIQNKKYRSTFSLEAQDSLATRVAFSLSNSSKMQSAGNTSPIPKGVFFQFGLSDLVAGTTTLTYLVKIIVDGQLLWSGQVKYGESQITSVVLDVEGRSDVVFEYQVVEAGGVYSSQNPLYFTDAKLLFK